MESLIPLWPIFLALVLIPLSRHLDARQRRMRVESWITAAHAARLRDVVEETGSWGSPSVVSGWAGLVPGAGRRGPRAALHRVRFEQYVRDKQTGTRVTIEGDSGITLRQEGLGTAFQKAMGAREVETGDEAFDRMCYVRGVPEVLRAVLDVKTRALVRELIQGRVELAGSHAAFSGVDVAIHGGDLVAEFQMDSKTFWDGLPRAVETLLDAARRLARPASVVARLVENARWEPNGRVRLLNVLQLAGSYPEAPEAREVFRLACQDESQEVQLRAALALGGEEGRAVLLDIAGREWSDDPVAARAVATLGEHLPSERALAVLFTALRKRRLETARACVEVLGRAGGPGVLEPLAKVLAIETGELAAAAARALGACGPAAERSLVEALRRDDADLRVAAAEALGHVGSPTAVLPLKEVAEASKDGAVRRAARQAIAEVQSRLSGASPGQLSLAEGDAGRLSLADEDPRGRVSMAAQDDAD